MVLAVGLSSYNIALFHLVNHAFYKGLLFLGAGAVIHAWADNQDFRKYGALRVFLPLTYTVMLIASLSLVAFPFMTGFYSKDFILESAYGHYSFSSLVIYFIATVGAMFTTLYSVKVLYLTFLTNPNGPLINYNKAHEGDIYMSIPLIILALFSIFFGYLTKDIFIGIASCFFSDNSLFIHPSHEITLDTEFAVHSLFKLLPLALTISLIIVSLVLSEYLTSILIYFKYSRLGYNTFSFFNQRFLIELLYNKYITGVIFKLGAHTTKVLDKGFLELIGPFGLEKLLLNVSTNIAVLDSGVITSYALYILIGLLTYILIPYTSVINSSMLLLIILALFVNLSYLYKSLNWMLASPPKPHSFTSLPAQSLSVTPLFLTPSEKEVKDALAVALHESRLYAERRGRMTPEYINQDYKEGLERRKREVYRSDPDELEEATDALRVEKTMMDGKNENLNIHPNQQPDVMRDVDKQPDVQPDVNRNTSDPDKMDVDSPSQEKGSASNETDSPSEEGGAGDPIPEELKGVVSPSDSTRERFSKVLDWWDVLWNSLG